MLNLLNKINNDPQIRPYLHVYPFSIDNVKIMISFDTLEGKRVDSRYIVLVFCAKGKIFYKNYVNNSICPVHEEPYTEALRIFRSG